MSYSTQDIYYGVEPYSGDIVQHFGIPGMKWGWSKDGRKTGAKEAMTEDERKARRQQLLKKVGTALGVAAAVGGGIAAYKNRGKIKGALTKFKNRNTTSDNVKTNLNYFKNKFFKKPSKIEKIKSNVTKKIKDFKKARAKQKIVSNLRSLGSNIRFLMTR